ncbi:WXG100 family type VII secretion target [Streptomyces termitum]|uniref:WXG100 family type VII secretion target n=1 Tax=Streptomyces termitum TaxID=67368 RepID=A0A918WBX3_9ACTN|nr:WXG100 family type VII secretion target [Streptomyces termitum]GHA99271.1 hypothetical protein GCM10010305_48240 [Streptomyces termitum]
MSVLKVGDQSLKDFQDELTRKFDDVKGQLTALQGVIDSLEGRWKGIGAGAFDAKQTEINQGMVRIAKLMLNFQEAIQVTRTSSSDSDDEAERALRGIDVTAGFSGDAGAEKAARSGIAGL